MADRLLVRTNLLKHGGERLVVGRRRREAGPEGGVPLAFSLPREAFAEALRSALSGVGRLTPSQAERLYAHYQLLGRWNRVVNLTGMRSAADLVVRHYAESLFLAKHLPAGPLSLLDIGSGAGLPGIPVAVAREDCRVTLAECDRRKASFLREVTREWGHVVVHFGRAEETREYFDWAISRGVAFGGVLRAVRGRAQRLGLLVGGAGAGEALACNEVAWEEPVKLPWGRDRWLLLGDLRARGRGPGNSGYGSREDR